MTVTDVCVRSEERRDEPGIRRVHERAFGRMNEARLVSELRTTAAYNRDLSLVAVYDTEPVGHLLLYPVRIVLNETDSGTATLSLAPLGVEPLYQNLGIGSLLVREAISRACAHGYESIVVLGHPGYYPRFGFRTASRWHIYPPFDVQDNHFMALELTPGALARAPGTVLYPPQYDEV